MVDTNEWLRQRVWRFVKLGVSQKTLAAKMGMAASTLSKWLNRAEEIGPATLPALDGFHAFVREVADAVAEAIPGLKDVPGVPRSHTPAIAIDGLAEKADGGDRAGPFDSAQAPPLSPAETQLREKFDAAVRAEKQQQPGARATRKPAPAARAKRTGRAARARKARR